MQQINKCIICREITTKEHKKATWLLGLKEPFRVIRCEKCDLAWLNIGLSADEYMDIYAGERYFVASNEHPGKYSDIVMIRLKYFKRRIIKIKSLFEKNSKIKLLDIGTATGEFVSLCRENKIDAIGLELSDWAVRKAKKRYGKYYYQGDLFNNNLPPLKFDVIHLNHVFEHFLNPISNLLRIYELLKKDGLLIIEVPFQFDNIIEKFKSVIGKQKPHEYSLFSIHHPFFYTTKSISKLLSVYGFTISSLKFYPPSTGMDSKIIFGKLIKPILLYLGARLFRNGNTIEIYAWKR